MHLLTTCFRKIRSFTQLPKFEQFWFLPTWCLLGSARFIILFISFKRFAHRLGTAQGTCAWVPLISPAQAQRALQIRNVVLLAAHYTPWTSNCFPQAIAARCLLAGYGIPYALYLGLAPCPPDDPNYSGKPLKAHAWVQAGRVPVSGGYGFDTFTAVGVFVSTPSPHISRP